MSFGPRVGTSRHLHPSQAPRRGGQGLWAPPSDGSQPWAKPGIGSSEEETSRGRMGTMRMSGPTAPQPHCEAPGPLSAYAVSPLQQPSLLSLWFPNIRWVGWCFSSNAYENLGGGETLKTQVGTVTLRLQNAWNNNFFWQTWTTLTSH